MDKAVYHLIFLPGRTNRMADRAEIGKYRILSQIGEGAMGVVYRGLDPVLNRPVAIKVMNDAVARDNDLRARFLREAQSAGSLQHPNVVTIYDFGEVDGHPFIAMQLVEGADLDELLRHGAPLTLVEKIDILIDVLNGLSYAHKRGIVHRDIKPANIRIDEEGRARIMDFGIAHLNSSNASKMTKTGVMVGTPAYMSPEQITAGSITPSSDIFSVGAVMFELMSGTTVYQADTLQSMMYQIVAVPAPSLTAIVPAPSGPDAARIVTSLDQITMRALAKEPPERFATALEMATALSDVRARVIEGQRPAGPASLRASVAHAMASTAEVRPPQSKLRPPLVIASAIAAVTLIAAVLIIRRPPVHASLPAAPVAPTPVVAADTTPPAPVSSPQPTASPARAAKADVTNDREAALVRDLQTTALEERRRAVDAGASAASLAAGDEHNRVAAALVAQGKVSEGGEHLTKATVAWTAAERDARLASTPTTPASPARAPDPGRANLPSVAAITSSATQQSAPAPNPTVVSPPPMPASPAPAPSNPAADIAVVVNAYARALESRDVAAVRRAYPALTSQQAKGWEQFFSTLRSLRVTLAASALDINGIFAGAKVSGTYDYVTDAGKSVQQPVSFQASFKRDGGVWQLVAVR